MIVISIICVLCGYLLLHSYLIYPKWMQFLHTRKEKREKGIKSDNTTAHLPTVSILIPAYNEELVIGKKLESIVQSDYPSHLLNVYVGSDCSTDETNHIVHDFSKKYPFIHLLALKNRSGKTNVINQLVQQYITPDANHICILTDANIIFHQSLIQEIVEPFVKKDIGLVCGNVVHREIDSKGIASSEAQYIRKENALKYYEGNVLGASMGAFGACFAIRSSNIEPIPSHFIVDDFYLTMKTILKRQKAITKLEATCYEDLPTKIRTEFARKRRMAAGNIQNLVHFTPLLIKFSKPIFFAFFSHKIIRWAGPFLLLMLYITSGILAIENDFFRIQFMSINGLLLLSLFDFVLEWKQIHVPSLRILRYFLIMNLAVFIGWIDFAKGIKTSIWDRTTRHVSK